MKEKKITISQGAYRARPLPVIALATAGAAGLAAQAFAASDYIKRGPDTVARGQTVFERQRPLYDAKGLPLGDGGLTFLPSVEVSETFQTNVYAQSSGAEEDFETIVAPRLTLKSNWSRHSFGASAFGMVHRYAELETENNEEYGFDVSGGLDLAHDSSLTASGGYQKLTVDRGDPEQSNGTASAPEQIHLRTAKLEYSHPFGRVRMTVGGTVSDYRSANDADLFSNRTEYAGKVRAAYTISAALNAFIEPAYTVRRYGNTDRAERTNRDVDISSLGFGVAYDITGQLYGETTVGYYSAKFDSNTFSDQSGIFIRSEATWNLSALTTIISGIERGNQASNVGTASSATTSAIDIRVERELARNVTAALTGRYQHEEYEDVTTPRTDTFMQFGWIANYLLDRHVALFLKYDFSERSSDIDTSDYKDHQITFGVKGQL